MGVKEDIKSGNLARVYLIYGTESYLKTFYKNKLKEVALAGGDPMNVATFAGSGISERSIIDEADTMPFFAEHRVVMIEDSGLFKKASDLADYIKNIPETTVMIFTESEVDKRNRLYKAVNEVGVAEEFNALSEGDLLKWVGTLFKKSEKNITTETARFFLERVGTDMNNLVNEVEKLVCYTGERPVIEKADILSVSSEHVEGKIFEMMDAIGSKKQEEALRLYYDLLTLRQTPAGILALTIRQFNLLYVIKDMAGRHIDNKTIASTAGIAPFFVNKYISQSRNFDLATLKEAVAYGTELETDFKQGRIEDRIACELLIVRYSI